ncbi:MAG TPA: nitroreductase family protein [Dehalococcoidales bacterium]|nr:nitroreductase family protein [Dehalococcoidales bacterium]
MEVIAAINARRSIRRYKPDPIADNVMSQLLEAVRVAPSWANSQCWRVVVVTDKELKDKLADTMYGFGGRASQTAEGMKIAPVAVAFCAELGKSGYTFVEPREPATDKGGYWYMFDVALAMENFILAAQSFNLGTVIIGAFNPQTAGDLLKVPTGFTVVALTPLGYPAEDPPARPRKAISEIIFKNQFNSAW